MLLSLVTTLFMSGCFGPKYIPSSYFLSRHDLKVDVKSIPDPVHLEESSSQSNSLLGDIIKAAANSSRKADLQKAFAHIDSDEVRNNLQASISAKIEDHYNVKHDSKDLAVEVKINSWGWILPTSSMGIRTGSYYLQMTGKVVVYDEYPSRKEIGHIYLTTREAMQDNMSPEETTRRVKRAVDEFADLSGDFLWRSDEKK